MFKFREGTLDESEYYDVFTRNEYQLPKSFNQQDVIIDIGSGIGSFTSACLERGCNVVFTFQPDETLFKLNEENLCAYGPRVRLYNECFCNECSKYSFIFENIDEVISLCVKVRLLKIDCKNKELEIIKKIGLFKDIKEICGKYYSQKNLRELTEFLVRQRFKTTFLPNPNDKTIGLFWCKR